MTTDLALVHVPLAERSYDIWIGAGGLAQFGDRARNVGPVRHAVIIADEKVAENYGTAVARSLAATGARTDVLRVPSGEASKSVEQAQQLWWDLLRDGADRHSWVVAVGGGVVGDLAGFVAATYARGIAFAQVPTTLLAQVDSSVGGKVGINLPGAKNMVGCFWQPRLVLIDPATLTTLPAREFQSGLAEVVKYGVILDADFFEELEQDSEPILQRDASVLRRVIARCCELKAAVVSEDERETTGRRAVLNYGHTFGHAIEAITGYDRFLHGEAVAIGMHYAARLACELGRVDASFVERQDRLLAAFGLAVRAPGLSTDGMLHAMRHDKKSSHGQLRFVLPTRLGHVELVDNVPADIVRRVIEE